MDFTRYYTEPERDIPGYDEAFVMGVKQICDVADKQFGIKLGNADGTDEPIITSKNIVLNGWKEAGENADAFSLGIDYGWNFCKTNQQPYDAVVNAILLLAFDFFYVHNLSADDLNNERTATYLYDAGKERSLDYKCYTSE